MEGLTMATANRPNMHFRPTDLLPPGQFPGEELEGNRELVEEVDALVTDVLKKLVPSLKYVVQPLVVYQHRRNGSNYRGLCPTDESIRCRALPIGINMGTGAGEETLLLTEDGRILPAERCVLDSRHLHASITDGALGGPELYWHNFYFDEFFEALTRVYEKAEEKKRQHLKAVETRTDLLRSIQKQIRGE